MIEGQPPTLRIVSRKISLSQYGRKLRPISRVPIYKEAGNRVVGVNISKSKIHFICVNYIKIN